MLNSSPATSLPTEMRVSGIRVSNLLRAADEYGMWQVSGTMFKTKVLELTQGSESFAEKYLEATPSDFVFVSWSYNAECGLGAVIALIAECLAPDDTVFIDLLCFAQHDPTLNATILQRLEQTFRQSRGLLMPCLVDDETLQLSHADIRAIKSWKDAPIGLQRVPFARMWCIPELYVTALDQKPIVIAFGRASRHYSGRIHFERLQNAVLFDKMGKLASFEDSITTEPKDKELIWKIILGFETSRGVASSADAIAIERVHRLLEAAARGAIVSSEWPKVQAAACARNIDDAEARQLAYSIDSQGRTALMAAAAAGYKNVVDAILAAGGDADAVDASGKTAASFASGSHVPRVLEAILTKSAAPLPPTTSAPAHGEYLVFLSHKQTDAKDFARALHAQFTLRGVPTFLDMEFKEELNDLEAIVAQIPNFIFILSDNVLESKWCLKELASAIRSNANVILVTKEGARWGPDRESTFPPYSLIETLPEEVRPAFTSKAIAHSDEYYQSFIDGLFARIKTPNSAGEGPTSRALGRWKQVTGPALAGPQPFPASAMDLSGLQDKLSQLVDAQLDLVGELRAQRGAAAQARPAAEVDHSSHTHHITRV